MKTLNPGEALVITTQPQIPILWDVAGEEGIVSWKCVQDKTVYKRLQSDIAATASDNKRNCCSVICTNW